MNYILDPVLKAMLDEAAEQNAPSLSNFPPEIARAAVKEMIVVEQPTDVAHIEDIVIPGTAGDIPARVYRPSVDETLPALVFYHGGGWVICDLDTHDEVCRRLATEANCTVISVDYRLAPEHLFPAAVDDSLSALNWVAENAAALNVDKSRIAVGGDSAGGNLATAVALHVRDKGGPAISFQLLIYPVTDMSNTKSGSYLAFQTGHQLTRDDMIWFRDSYLGEDGDATHPHVSPLLANSHSDLPAAYVATAGFDVLRDEGMAYAEALAAAGVDVEHDCYGDQIHGFANLAGAVPSSTAALSAIAKKLEAAHWG